MTGHADTVREAFAWLADYAEEACGLNVEVDQRTEVVLGALAALERERDEALRERDWEIEVVQVDLRERAEASERERDTLRAALERMLDPAWWREDVDVNGEYTTTRPRGYYECVGEIREALAEAGSDAESEAERLRLRFAPIRSGRPLKGASMQRSADQHLPVPCYGPCPDCDDAGTAPATPDALKQLLAAIAEEARRDVDPSVYRSQLAYIAELAESGCAGGK